MSGKTCWTSLSFTQYFLSSKSSLLHPRTNICRLGLQIDMSELLWSSTPEYIPDSTHPHLLPVLPGIWKSPGPGDARTGFSRVCAHHCKHVAESRCSNETWIRKNLRLILKTAPHPKIKWGLKKKIPMSWMLIGSWFQALSLGVAFPGLQVVSGAAAEWLEGRARTTRTHTTVEKERNTGNDL